MDSDVTFLGKSTVVDFQATRCAIHVRKFQTDLSSLFAELASAAEADLISRKQAQDPDTDSRDSRDVVAVVDILRFRSLSEGGLLRASWTPFSLFVDQEEVLSIRASYDSQGSKITGIRFRVDGKYSTSKSKRMTTSVVRKVCLSYIQTYVRGHDE